MINVTIPVLLFDESSNDTLFRAIHDLQISEIEGPSVFLIYHEQQMHTKFSLEISNRSIELSVSSSRPGMFLFCQIAACFAGLVVKLGNSSCDSKSIYLNAKKSATFWIYTMIQ
jgi:hypothetical protein